MTTFVRFSALKAITAGVGFTLTTSLALAGDGTVPADQIVRALQHKPETRGLSRGEPQVDQAKAKEISFIASVRNRRTRSLSLGEREEIAEIASTKPNIDLEINFDYNSAEISKASLPAAQELGKALSSPSLKGSTFLVAGHTDGIGGYAFNQDLSERRADTIKNYLVQKFGINGSGLVTVGYGKTKLKDAKNPAAPVNRRVQVVNMGKQETAQK